MFDRDPEHFHILARTRESGQSSTLVRDYLNTSTSQTAPIRTLLCAVQPQLPSLPGCEPQPARGSLLYRRGCGEHIHFARVPRFRQGLHRPLDRARVPAPPCAPRAHVWADGAQQVANIHCLKESVVITPTRMRNRQLLAELFSYNCRQPKLKPVGVASAPS